MGQPGRGDDAAGLIIAEALAEKVSDQVTIQCFHQLGPELAEDVAAAEHVIFIDAHVKPEWPDLVCREVDPADEYVPDSHSSGPEELMGLAEVLYHRRPKAHLIATRAFDTAFGAGLSRRGEQLEQRPWKLYLACCRQKPCVCHPERSERSRARQTLRRLAAPRRAVPGVSNGHRVIHRREGRSGGCDGSGPLAGQMPRRNSLWT